MKRLSFEPILMVLVLLFVGLAWVELTSGPLSKTDLENLRKAAVELKEAILHEDVDGILCHVSKSKGLWCTDTQIPYQQVRKDLHNKNSHLYMSLFDSIRFSKQCGHEYSEEYPAISDKEFFAKAANESIEIVSIADGWATVRFRSQTKGHFPREYTFQKEERAWKLRQGFIVGSCSCG